MSLDETLLDCILRLKTIMQSDVCLAQNRYGKAENRVFRVTRNGAFHEVLDLNVTVQLCGDFEVMHTTGSNAACVATDSQKNTVFVMAQKLGGGAAMAPEAFALALGRHFLSTYALRPLTYTPLLRFNLMCSTQLPSHHARGSRRGKVRVGKDCGGQRAASSRLQAQRQLCSHGQGCGRPQRCKPIRLERLCVQRHRELGHFEDG